MWWASALMPAAGDLAVDGGAAGLGVLERLEDDHAGALAEHEAVAALVVGTRRTLGLVVAGGQGLHGGEAGQRQRMDGGLGAARSHDVRPAAADHVHGVGDGLGAAGAGADRGVDAGPGRQLQAHLRGGPVGHQHRDGHRQHPTGALLLERVVGREQRRDTADAGGDHDADPLRVDLGGARVGPGLAGSDQGELPGPVGAPDHRDRQHLGRVDRYPRSDVHGQRLDPVLGQDPHPGLAGQHGSPGRRHVATEWRRRTQAGHHHALGVGQFGVSHQIKLSVGVPAESRGTNDLVGVRHSPSRCKRRRRPRC